MPVLINDVVTEFEPPARQPGTEETQNAASPSATSAPELMAQIAEQQALLHARQQRLEVD